MLVAHLCAAFSPLSQTFIYDYVTELERQGVRCHVVAQERENPEARPFERATVVPKPSVFDPRRLRYRLLELFGRSPWGLSSRRVLRDDLEKALRRIVPDVVHAHFGPRGVLAGPVARRIRRPLVVSFYGFDISMLVREERWRRDYRKLWEEASAVVALSEAMREEVQVLGCPPEKTHVVHLGRDLDAFAYRPPRGTIERFVSVGRLVEKKGHLDALAAFRKAAADNQRTCLQIVGDGPLRERMATYIATQGLSGRVELLGALPNEQVCEALRAADAFLLCSKTAPDGDREGTPTVLIEAQAVGLPCVSTRHAAIPEMLPAPNHWLLAEEGDVESLADRLRRLMRSSPEKVRQIAEHGRAKVEAEFDLTRETAKLRALYEEVQAPEASGPRGGAEPPSQR